MVQFRQPRRPRFISTAANSRKWLLKLDVVGTWRRDTPAGAKWLGSPLNQTMNTKSCSFLFRQLRDGVVAQEYLDGVVGRAVARAVALECSR